MCLSNNVDVFVQHQELNPVLSSAHGWKEPENVCKQRKSHSLALDSTELAKYLPHCALLPKLGRNLVWGNIGIILHVTVS